MLIFALLSLIFQLKVVLFVTTPFLFLAYNKAYLSSSTFHHSTFFTIFAQLLHN